ncbi:MAG: HAMP domain-containing protein [Deltaproteobacteria bacterium]|nr:HAMP domain-containing protein [Deltaproteobacteria bacterium]
MSWYKSISVKIVLSVVGIIVAVNGSLAYMYLSVQKKHLNETILKTATQLSETIKKSIQYDMLENRKEHAYKIMETIGRQEGIDKVRIYSYEGKILFSSDRHETGKMVDKRAEACYACHSEASPIERLSTSRRSRIFYSDGHHRASDGGHRILGIINPLYNEKGCSSAECHAHPGSKKVLGVIDLTMSLGDLDHVIPVTTRDEMGHLAASFNQMTRNLKRAHEEIQEGIKNLEERVEERTRELTATQEQLLHSEKLVAVGKLAATVAHEINNPLTGVYTYIKLMERKLEQGRSGPEEVTKYMEYLATMRREVERTTAIVQNLLDFTRPKEPLRKPISLVKLIEETLFLLRNKLSLNNIAVVNRVAPLPEIMADPSQMKQIFINIMINACEAMERGGTLTIGTSHNAAENTVTVNVCDTGVGIDTDDLSRVFDPFFTTKEKGTGLGLSVVHGIVSKHNGRVEMKSRKGEGTLVRITLPIS